MSQGLLKQMDRVLRDAQRLDRTDVQTETYAQFVAELLADKLSLLQDTAPGACL